MNFFENELRKLAAVCDEIINPVFAGRVCFCELGDNNRAKLEFTIIETHEKYEALNVKILNRLDGDIDNLKIRFEDLWGRQQDKVMTIIPHVWTYNGKSEWYVWQPSDSDIKILAAEVGTYLSVFKEQSLTRKNERTGVNKKESIVKPLQKKGESAQTNNNSTRKKKENEI